MQNEKKQHKVFVVGFSLIILVVLVFLLRPVVTGWIENRKSSDEQKANAEILKAPSVMPEDVFKKIQDNSKIFLVDLSSSDDFKRGHIAASVNVSAEKLNKDFWKSIGADKAADIFLVDQGGDLAGLATAVNKVVAEGFANAKYLRGGIPGWQEKGYPLVSSSGSDEDNAKVKKITIDEIKVDAASNPDSLQFLDVRDKGIFAKEHIVGALNVPLAELETRKNEIPAAKKVIAYGANDQDSFQAAATLFDLNFFNVYQMQGSIDDWKAAGGNTQ